MTVQENSEHDASVVARASRELPGAFFRRVPITTIFPISTYGFSVAVYSLYDSDILRTYAVQAQDSALKTCRGRSRGSAMYQKSDRASHLQDVQLYASTGARAVSSYTQFPMKHQA